MQVVADDDIVDGFQSGAEACAAPGVLLPLRQLTASRLPSIPERSHRALVAEMSGMSGISTTSITSTEQDEPLPPCKC